MVPSVLFDQAGEPWPAAGALLARSLGYLGGPGGLAAFAVRERGFIRLEPIEDGARIMLRIGGFSLAALAGAMQALNDAAPRRIILVALAEAERHVEFFASTYAFVEFAEHLAGDQVLEVKVPRYSVPRHLRNLATPPFAAVRPVADFWRATKGVLSDDLFEVLAHADVLHRSVLARQLPNSSRLVCEHFGRSLRIRPACETLLALGRGLEEMYDRAYGEWLADGYAEALASRRLGLLSARAQVQVSEAMAVHGRYDRLVMPWRRGAGDLFVLGISIRRSLSAAC